VRRAHHLHLHLRLTTTTTAPLHKECHDSQLGQVEGS
jgi:hypothetical protein